MSILLAIGKSLGGRHARSRHAASARGEGVRPILGEWNGSEIASAASWQGAWSDGRRKGAAVFRKATLAVLS
jgi:hypothetical protein